MGACLDIRKTVRKSNILNEMRNANTSMAEYRLFCIYLAHFNMKDPNNNAVSFWLKDYARIVGLDRPRKIDIEKQANNILQNQMHIENPDGGFTRRPIFSEFKLHKQDDSWLVTLECNAKLAPLIREEGGRFIRYKLYNTLFLKSFNQQRIYELLKQYERIGERTIELSDLREYLSIKPTEYPVWGVFSRDVLKVSQKAIAEVTDIAFDFEPIKKKNKVVAVKFTIRKNEAYKDILKLEGLLPASTEIEYEGDEIAVFADPSDDECLQMSLLDEEPVPVNQYENAHFEFLADACDKEFTQEQMEALISLPTIKAMQEISLPFEDNQMIKFNYLTQKYKELNLRANETEIKNRFKYFKKMIENDDV